MQLLKFRIGSWQFAPTLWPTLVAGFFFVLTLSLGNWQTHRADTKRALQSRVDAAEHDAAISLGTEPVDKDALLFRRVEARGEFDPAHEILLDNRIHDGVAGYHVLTPLRIAGGDLSVLVNRGWIAVGKRRDVLPRIAVVVGSVTIEGLALDPRSRYVELGPVKPDGKVWQNLDFQRYAATSGLKLQPILLQQVNDTGDGLLRDWPRPDTGVAMHVSYALQWYSLAATLAVLWVVMNLKRDKVDRTS